MEHGVFIEKGLSDWQIVQHQNGFADITLCGTWIVTKNAVKQGVQFAEPMIRVLKEDDGSQIISWKHTDMSTPDDTGYAGTWETTLHIPAGGLYRIETGLRTTSTQPGIWWMFRGDTRLHFGVGDVFLIGGQSNSAGYGKDTAFDPPELGVHLFRNRHQWDIASHPFHESTFNAGVANAEEGVSGNSPYLSFGKAFRKLSHYPVGLIATAKGGMPMKKWTPGRGSLYLNMVEQAKACGPIAGVLWYQGCSDTDDKYVDYKERYYTMIEEFRKDLGYPVKFFTFQLNRQINGFNDEGWGVVREAQRTASHDFDDLYILPTINCGLSDAIHNNAHSCMLLGERMARMCGHVLYDTPAYFAPEIISAKAEENILKLTFNNVEQSFMIPSEFGKDSGFTVLDAEGKEIPSLKLKRDSEDGNTLLLSFEEPLPANCTVSFAWEANPVAFPVLDEVTFLPPLSFYKYPVEY